ncbi:uncharacterized protein GGS22DRAFT_65983 [Annulohypoxylon maeteangense]|uniref:uncharacterized protein n=1 Tax=Annulohypoxylon maeteangense TaxID=1927788 RepID=UPI0020082DF2|nr:uncharacterized protein GGS22DRAFT_65983 [Annulohypoxylon maeteangense]KAI0889004.1 hypothetical protein GGS22DRAFT_65983 [Annulohypoxylon maeteangense]
MADNPLDLPAMDPPPGEVQDLNNPPNKNDVVVAVYTVCIIIVTAFVAMRLYAKFVFLKASRIEDYLLVPTFGIFIAHCVYWIKMNGTTGNFVHTWNFRVRDLAPFYENGFYGLMFYETVMMTIKPLILLEWIHIFILAGPRTAFKWTCYILGTINVLMYFIAIMIDAGSCRPRAYWWDKTIEGGTCINTIKLPIVTGTINAIIDLFILLLPQGIIWRLQMSSNKRIGVSLVFAVGVISVAAAITRTVLGYIYAESDDVAYNFSQAGVFCLVEMTAAILVFTAPTVPKPTTHLAKQATSSIDRLLRSNRSGSFATGSVGSKSNIYQHIDEHGNEVHLVKLRSAKSKASITTGPKSSQGEV